MYIGPSNPRKHVTACALGECCLAVPCAGLAKRLFCVWHVHSVVYSCLLITRQRHAHHTHLHGTRSQKPFQAHVLRCSISTTPRWRASGTQWGWRMPLRSSPVHAQALAMQYCAVASCCRLVKPSPLSIPDSAALPLEGSCAEGSSAKIGAVPGPLSPGSLVLFYILRRPSTEQSWTCTRAGAAWGAISYCWGCKGCVQLQKRNTAPVPALLLDSPVYLICSPTHEQPACCLEQPARHHVSPHVHRNPVILQRLQRLAVRPFPGAAMQHLGEGVAPATPILGGLGAPGCRRPRWTPAAAADRPQRRQRSYCCCWCLPLAADTGTTHHLRTQLLIRIRSAHVRASRIRTDHIC